MSIKQILRSELGKYDLRKIGAEDVDQIDDFLTELEEVVKESVRQTVRDFADQMGLKVKK